MQLREEEGQSERASVSSTQSISEAGFIERSVRIAKIDRGIVDHNLVIGAWHTSAVIVAGPSYVETGLEIPQQLIDRLLIAVDYIAIIVC
jgi:hypothetical protein